MFGFADSIRFLLLSLVLSFALGVPQSDALQKNGKYWDHTINEWVDDRPSYYGRRPDQKYNRRKVRIKTREKIGTIIVDTQKKFLYLVTGRGRAMRYGVGVGRRGFEWNGIVTVSHKAKWPSWTPPPVMIERVWRQQGRKIGFMKGGEDNPMGARALYLYRKNGADTGYRIHGTNAPWSIGQSMSSGCIRMLNKDVKHLYEHAKVGSKVIVIGPNGKNRNKYYETKGTKFSLSSG